MMLKQLIGIFALLMIATGCAWSQEVPSSNTAARVIYEKGVQLPGWEFSAGEGSSMTPTAAGLGFTINVWEEGRDMWPRISMRGPRHDLAEYSQLIFEIENPSDTPQSICVAANDDKGERSAIASQLPAARTGRVILDISDGMPFDQSSVVEIVLYEFRPLHRVDYVLKKLTAIRNPDFVSRRTALQQRISQVQGELSVLKKSLSSPSAKTETVLRQCHALLDAATAAYENKVPGYAIATQAKLLEAQSLIARTSMDLRQKEVWLWASPLGLALRDDSLPSTQDAELRKIEDVVCLNQYKIICVNVSAAAQAQTVEARLRSTPNQAKILALRPALFSKARDGSRTADAVGEKTSKVTLTIPPYSSGQIMLWIDTKGAASRAGSLQTALDITSVSANGTRFSRSLPVNIRIANVRLKQQLPLSVQNWAFFYMGNTVVTQGLEKEAVANLRDYGATTWMTDYNQVPLPSLDASGKYVGMEPGKLERLKQVLELVKCRSGEDFVTWLGFERPEMRETLAKPGVLEGYLKDLRTLLDQHGVPLEKRYLYLWDEPKLPELREGMQWKRRIKQIDPSFKFVDNGSVVPEGKELQEFAELTERWLPNWEQLYLARPSDAQRLMALNKPELGFYRCLVSRKNRGVNVYEYYGLMGWYAMQYGLGTVGYWVHSAGEEDPWDGTKGAVSGVFSVYRQDNKLLTSRRMELFREGLEDYKLAQAAFGVTGQLDARKIPQLKKMCEEVASRPNDLGYSDLVRRRLISMAEAKSKIVATAKPKGQTKKVRTSK